MVELETAAFNRKPDLANFFYDCDGCDYTLRFDWYDQVRDCPKCGRSNSLSPAYRRFFGRKRKIYDAGSGRFRDRMDEVYSKT